MEQFQTILWSALGVIVTGLVSWAVAALTAWLNSKIKNEKVAKYLTAITTIVGTSVKEVFQTYVEALKKENSFTVECQKKALDLALTKAKAALSDDLIGYISTTYGDVEQFLISQIESTIYSLKQKSEN